MIGWRRWSTGKCVRSLINNCYIHNPESILENEMHNLLWDFVIKTTHLISPRRSYFAIAKKKKKGKKKQKTRTCRIVNCGVPVIHIIKLKESQKKDKYLDPTRELKKLWNVKVLVIPIVIGALDSVSKGFVKRLEDLEIRGRLETIQSIVLSTSARILRRLGGFLWPRLHWKITS